MGLCNFVTSAPLNVREIILCCLHEEGLNWAVCEFQTWGSHMVVSGCRHLTLGESNSQSGLRYRVTGHIRRASFCPDKVGPVPLQP